LLIEGVFLCSTAEADPVLDALLEEGQLDMSELTIGLLRCRK
jgi:hypothetical protein